MILAGIDLAWNGEKNPSALAVGKLQGKTLSLTGLHPAVTGMASVMEMVTGAGGLAGIAVDASLIITNSTGQRPCEKALARMYSAKGAACHATNLSLYPDPFSVRLSHALEDRGFGHLGEKKWQIECYPHPSIIEIFGLQKRLKYKKGPVPEKKEGQIRLASYLRQLSTSSTLRLHIPEPMAQPLAPSYIQTLKGQALKTNEDTLDAMVCLYVAALYAKGAPHTLFGDTATGYVWVPKGSCL